MKIERAYVLCNATDLWMAAICVASIRYWYAELPITLLKDLSRGDFDSSELERAMGIDARIPARRVSGWGFAKLELYFEEPAKRILVLDADTIVCGAVLEKLEGLDADFVVSSEELDPGTEHFRRIYYDLPAVTNLVPSFAYPGFAFNTGQIVATTGVLQREDFHDWVTWSSPVELSFPKVFSCADQGVLNVAVATLVSQQRLTVAAAKFALWGADPAVGDIPCPAPGVDANAVIVHFAGPKDPRKQPNYGRHLQDCYERYYFKHIRFGAARRVARTWRRAAESRAAALVGHAKRRARR